MKSPQIASRLPRRGRALASACSWRTWIEPANGVCNTVPWSEPFRRLAADAQLTGLYGDGAWSAYSWPTWNPLLRVPLDNCLVSDGLAVTGHRHGADIGSDHFPLVVDMAVLRKG